MQGKAAVVTGASRGIGRAVALALAAEGASVVVNGRDAAAVDGVVAQIRREGGVAHAFVGSVADFEIAAALVEACVDRHGAIDALVNCAGVAEPDGSSILDLSAEAWHELIGVHLTGTFNTCRHAAPRMAERRAGTIVNTSSHAYLGRYGGTGYPAGKGGVNSLSFAIAAELREFGVRANAVCPGGRTRLSTGPDYERHIEALHARGLLDDVTRQASLSPPDPEHTGPLYAFLASDRSEGITGRLFTARGGYVGVHDRPSESLLAYRDEADGPWPVEALAQEVWSGLGGE